MVLALLSLLFLVGLTSTWTLEVNYDVLNSVVNNLDLEFELSVDPIGIAYDQGPIPIDLIATVGSVGNCQDFLVSPGGFVKVTSTKGADVHIDGFEGKSEQQIVKISLDLIQFHCIIPLLVTADEIFGWDVQVLNTGEDGELFVDSVTAHIEQSFSLYSPDFVSRTPVAGTVGTCLVNLGDITMTGHNLLEVIGLDLSSTVLDYLKNEPTIITDEFETELCSLLHNLSSDIIDLLIDNPLTNKTSGLYKDDPFDASKGDNGVMLALDQEFLLDTGDHEMFDFYDDNLVANLLFPEDLTTEPIVYTLLGFISNASEDSNIDPLIQVISDTFDLNISDHNGQIVGWNILELLNSTVEFEVSEALFEDALLINVSAAVTQFTLDVDPPTVVEGKNPPVLPNFIKIGHQTFRVPGINLNHIVATFGLDLRVIVDNLGQEGNLVLEVPFHIDIAEDVLIVLDWRGFELDIGVFAPAALDIFNALELGPVLDAVFDCFLSIFLVTPEVTGAVFSNDEITFSHNDFEEGLFDLVAQILDAIVPVYQSIIPGLVELIAADQITNKELIEPTECGRADPAFDDWDLYKYNFSEGIFKDIHDLVDVDLLNEVLGFTDTDDLDRIYLLGSNGVTDEGFMFNFTLPNLNGYIQDFYLSITQIYAENFLSSGFNSVEVFTAIENSTMWPQYLRNGIDLGDGSNRLKVAIRLNLTTTEPRLVNPDDAGNILPPPKEMYAQSNDFLWEISMSEISALLDLYVKYTQYDFDSREVGEILNPGCWIEDLLYPGGIEILEIILFNLESRSTCDCNNPLLKELTRVIGDSEVYVDIEEFLNDLLHRFGNLAHNLFSENKFDETIETSHQICETGSFSAIQLGEFRADEHETEITTLAPFMTSFLMAILLPTIIACILNRFGPRLKDVDKHHVNADLNKNILEPKVEEELNEIDVEISHLTRPMFKNPLIPLKFRVGVPLILITNLVLFLIGDTGNSVLIQLKGNILLVPLNFDNFATLSVITSVFQLWNSGGILLAFLLFSLSVAWPYIKLVVITFCWFLPPKYLSTTRRGKIIEMLDFLGRFSFAEFHFLVFVLVVFQIKGGSPNPVFLPQEDLLELRLEIVPLTSLFTFALAVVVSILVSNLMLVYQHIIEDRLRVKIREGHLKRIEDKRQETGILAYAIDEDGFQFRLTSWEFSIVDPKTRKNYTFSITNKASLMLCFSVICGTGILLAACLSKSLSVHIHGLVGFLIEFADEDRNLELSVFDLLMRVLRAYPGNPIIIFVGAVFVTTIALVPLMQTILLCVLLLKPVSLKEARNLAEAHHVISVWCCVDVFVVAVTLTVLELPTVAEGLVSAIPECETVGSLMEDILLPLGFVDQTDAGSSCISLESAVSIGAYIAVASVFFLNIVNFFVSRLFYFYISDREKVLRIEGEEDPFGEELYISNFHRRLERWGFIRFETKEEREKRMETFKEEMKVGAQVEVATATVVPKNKMVVEKRKKIEKQLMEKEFERNLQPDEKLVLQLTAFFEKMDPDSLDMVEPLVKEAMRRKDGLYRLNQKLMDTYGATINLEF